MLEILKELDVIRLNFSQDSLFILNITLAMIMFGVALGIKMNDFKQIALFPKPAFVGIASQFILLPMVTTTIAISLKNIITPTIAIGMILVACCPGGNISNFISSLSKANAALSVTLTAFATLSAIILTPLNFSIWGGVFIKVYSAGSSELLQPLVIDSIEMFETVAVLLGIPLITGMFVAHKFHSFTQKIIKPMKIISIVAFFSIVILSFAKNYEYFVLYIKYIFLIVLVHNFIGFMTGYWFASLCRTTYKNKKTITIETGIQNSGLALLLLFNPKIFPPEIAIGGMAFIAAWWGIWHILSGLILASYWSISHQKSVELAHRWMHNLVHFMHLDYHH